MSSEWIGPAQSGVANSGGRPRAAVFTPAGRGAIATIRIHADASSWPLLASLPLFSARGVPLPIPAPPGRISLCRWGHSTTEDVVVAAVDSQTLEVHCHGGDVAARRITEDLSAAGCEIVPWQTIVGQAKGPLESEIRDELARATTFRCAALLAEQADAQLLRAAIERILAADLDGGRLQARIGELLRWADFGLHLSRPWKVVVAGRPNVGKSSLINALLGFTRSLVFDVPGTTRDVVTETTAFDGWPVELADTAGMRESSDPVEAAGVRLARDRLADADLQIVLLDLTGRPTDRDRAVIDACRNPLIVAHKCDLDPFHEHQAWDSGIADRWIRVSSKTGEGLRQLACSIVGRLVPQVPPAGTPLPVCPRHVALLRRASAAGGDLEACRAALAAIVAGTPANG